MGASIGEPFHLASYGITQRFKKSKSLRNNAPNISVTHEKLASGSSDGYVTVTAQGDGVHILDLGTLHSVASHSLGPSTSFSCPSISIAVVEGEEKYCATYSGISSATDVPSERSSRTIWSWRAKLSNSLSERASEKRQAFISHDISQMYTLPGAPPRILALSQAGHATVLDTELNIPNSISPSTEVQILRSFPFYEKDASLLRGLSISSVIVLLEQSDAGMAVRVLSVTEAGKLNDLGDTPISVPSSMDILDASCSSSGYLSIIVQDGSWYSFRIEIQSSGPQIIPLTRPIRLKSLSFVDAAVKGSLDGEISIIALNTSLVLLAAITTSPSRNVILMLWDLQFSVLLSSQVLSIPSTLSTLPKLYISLRPTQMSSHAILVVSPPPSAEVSKSARSTIYAIPLVVPKMSTISIAMGRASAGSQWTVQDNENEEPASGKGKVLQQVRESLSKNDIKAAEQAFFDWEAANTKSQESAGEFGHTLVRDLLLVTLQPAKATSAYPSRIVHSLLRRRVVSAGMIEGGLLACLKQRNDWAAIILCMDHVTDLEESDLVSLLQSVTESSRRSQGSDAMQVDSATPSLSAFLRSCVTYRCSPAALRTALNRHLKQPDDVVLLLETLDGWLGSRKGAEVVALPSRKSVRKNEDGVSVLQQGAKDLELPLPKILSFAQTLIDATFLTLLQHTAAHAILRRLLAHIEPEISLTEQVDGLRGPLGIFAQAQAKAVRDGREKKNPAGDGGASQWRQRRRAAFDRAEMAVGIYQVEEIVL